MRAARGVLCRRKVRGRLVETDKLGRERGENWGRSLNRVIDMDGQKRAGWPFPPHFNSPRSSLSASPARPPPRPTTPRPQPPPQHLFTTSDDNHVGRPEAHNPLLVPPSALPSESQQAPLRSRRHPPYADTGSSFAFQARSPAAASPSSATANPRQSPQVVSEETAEVSTAGFCPSAAL